MTLEVRDHWADPVVGARRLAEEMRGWLVGSWDEYLSLVADARRHLIAQPLGLALTVPAQDGNSESARIGGLLAALDDDTWSWRLSNEVAERETVGVLSFGRTTRQVLEHLDPLGLPHVLYVDKAAVAQGLGYLRRTLVHRPPAEAEALLLPAAATHGDRVWTTTPNADAAVRAGIRGATVLIACHPLAELSDENRRAYRPASTLIDVKR